ncbi:MAG: hypothetical protein WB622_11155 [Acidobacteriaceae bacterium]
MATLSGTAAGSLTIAQAQRDVRTTYEGGFPGHLVVAALWLASAALATWGSHRAAILSLAIGGAFIFPLTQVVLRLMGRRASLPKGHPMNALARQIAFIVPICLPLIAAATVYRLDWFYPAFMIVVGAHYLPFAHLYGMWAYEVLAALLIGCGLLIGLYVPVFSLGAWVSAAAFLGFAFIARHIAAQKL